MGSFRALQAELGVTTNRAMPDWGREIFSDHCIMMRPEAIEDLSRFLKYSIGLTRVHLRFAHQLQPVQQNK